MYYLKLHHKKGQSVYKTIAATRVVMCMRILWFLAIASFACILLYVCVVSQCILILMHHVLKHRCTLTLTHRKAAAAHRAHQHTTTTTTTTILYHIVHRRAADTALCAIVKSTALSCNINIGKQNYRFGFP